MKLNILLPALFLLQLTANCQSDQSGLLSIDSIAASSLALGGYPDFLAVDKNDVWITNEKRIEKLSARNSKPVLTAEIPSPCGSPVVAFGSVWVANWNDKSVYRIDRNTGKTIAKIKTGLANKYGELSLAAGAGSVWLLSDSSGVLTRIDPKKNLVAKRIKVNPLSYCVAFGYGAVWITNTGELVYSKTGEATAPTPGSVQRINPATNSVVATIPVGLGPLFIAAGANGIWTLNQADGTVSRIDPISNKVKAIINAGATGSGGDIATGAGKVWIRGNKTVFLLSIDPTKNVVDEKYGPISGSGAVRVSEDNTVWVSSHDVHKVWLIKK